MSEPTQYPPSERPTNTAYDVVVPPQPDPDPVDPVDPDTDPSAVPDDKPDDPKPDEGE